MILVIGNDGCNKCKDTVIKLNEYKIEFTYSKLNDITKNEQELYLNLAREVKQTSLPLIIKNNKIITLQEVLNAVK